MPTSKKPCRVTFEYASNGHLIAYVDGVKMKRRTDLQSCREIWSNDEYILKIDGKRVVDPDTWDDDDDLFEEEYDSDCDNQCVLEIEKLKEINRSDKKYFVKVIEHGKVPAPTTDRQGNGNKWSIHVHYKFYVLEKNLTPLTVKNVNNSILNMYDDMIEELQRIIERYDLTDLEVYTIDCFKNTLSTRNWMITDKKELKIFDFAL